MSTTFNFHQALDQAADQAVGNTPQTIPQSFDWNGYELHHPEARRAVAECNLFATDLVQDKNRRWLSLLGCPGVGKTHLGQEMRKLYQKAFPHRAKRAQFWPWKDVVDDYLLKWDFGILDWLIHEVDFLVIDDIGAEQKTTVSLPNLYKILNARLGKWTVITSNLSVGEIYDMEKRIASRLVRGGSQIVTFRNCPDWSMEQFKKRNGLTDNTPF